MPIPVPKNGFSKIIPNDFQQFLNKIAKEECAIWQGGWSLDFPDPLNILQLLGHNNFPPGPNKNYYDNKTVEENIEKVIFFAFVFNSSIFFCSCDIIFMFSLKFFCSISS